MVKAAKNGKNLRYLRENNTNAVLKILATKGETSRIELSRILGLSKMTITNIVSDLIENGMVEETKVQENTKMSTTGPKPMLLAICSNRIMAIGIYASRNSIYCSLSDIRDGEIYCNKMGILEEDTAETFLDKVIALVEKILQYSPEYNHNIIGIGFTSVGIIDSNKGILISPTDFLNIYQMNIKEELERRFSYPVFVQNEAQASGVAELLYGHGRMIKNFIYMEISNGIGTAVINDGTIMTGSQGFASEAGHMCVDRNGKQCECGNRGCLEMYISVPVLLKESQCSFFEEFLEKIKYGEERASKVLENFIDMIDIGITNLVNIFDTDCIILGHEGALLHKQVLERIEDRVNSHIIQRSRKSIQIIASYFNEKAPIRGASCIVFNQLFSGSLRVMPEKE